MVHELTLLIVSENYDPMFFFFVWWLFVFADVEDLHSHSELKSASLHKTILKWEMR